MLPLGIYGVGEGIVMTPLVMRAIRPPTTMR